MANFTPISSLFGGLLIGLAVALLWLGNGRIAGISGIVGNVVPFRAGDVGWRLAFVAGLVLAPAAYAALAGVAAPPIIASPLTIIVGGLLVGFGTRLGSGCTSGHGICGLARLSPRSMVATALFMAAAFVTVFMTRHVLAG